MTFPTIINGRISTHMFLVSRVLLAAGMAAFGLPAQAFTQVMEGRLSVQVSDPGGGAVAAQVRLVGRSPDFVAAATADEKGRAVLKHLPPGLYRLTVLHPGFEAFSRRVEIRSAVPQSVQVVLQVGTLHEEVTVENPAPLLDPSQSLRAMHVGRLNLDRAPGTTLGRGTTDVVTTLPGWLLEANAVLHPRGSEYDTQYVIDGMPLYDNRSIAFAPAFENDEFESVKVLTAGIPAEFGRRLGGVIALDTRRSERLGHRTALDLQAGGFGTYLGSMSHQYAADRTVLSVGLRVGRTDRYLDPPSIENYTNSASSGGFSRPAGSGPLPSRPPARLPPVQPNRISRAQRSGATGGRTAPGSASRRVRGTGPLSTDHLGPYLGLRSGNGP